MFYTKGDTREQNEWVAKTVIYDLSSVKGYKTLTAERMYIGYHIYGGAYRSPNNDRLNILSYDNRTGILIVKYEIQSSAAGGDTALRIYPYVVVIEQ